MHLELLNETRVAPPFGKERRPCGIFPGVALNGDGSLCMLLVSGSDFESPDQETLALRGDASGMHWEVTGRLDAGTLGDRMTVYAKPTVLPDGTVVALGYGFERPDASTLSDYAEAHGRFPPVHNLVWRSTDGGATYGPPCAMRHGYDGIEFSGPALALADGTLLAFGPPFRLTPKDQKGICFASRDGGRTWREQGVYFNGDTIAPWESRGRRLPDGRLAVVFWAFDLAAQKHLTNRLAVSSDGGAAWKLLDTQLPGQASKLADCGWDDGALGLLQARREGELPGLYLTRIKIGENGVSAGETCELWSARSQAAPGASAEPFRSLKFGQPALHRLADGSLLLVFWRLGRDGYEVVLRQFRPPM